MKDCTYSIEIIMRGDFGSVENNLDEIVSVVSSMDLDAVSIFIKNRSEVPNE